MHVCYELRMLLFAAEHIEWGHTSPGCSPAGDHLNMALECFLLHFRNLRAFLCPTLQRVSESDILASDFLDEQLPSDKANAAVLGADKERLDRMLAHLSYDRERYIERREHSWLVQKLTGVIVNEFREFVRSLPQERTSWFTPTLEGEN